MSYEDQLIREATEGPSFQEVHGDLCEQEPVEPNDSTETGGDEQGETHNYLRLLCASNALKPYLEADINSHEPWSKEIDEFLSAIDALSA